MEEAFRQTSVGAASAKNSEARKSCVEVMGLARAQVMKVEVTVPARFVDAVTRDLVRRGGNLSERREAPSAVVLLGSVPFEAMSDYGIALRSMSDGYGTYRTTFDHFVSEPTA